MDFLQNVYCTLGLPMPKDRSSMVFYENCGLENLYGIVQYCQSKTECRRSAFFRHFAEPLQDYNEMCDNCSFSDEVKETDVSGMFCDPGVFETNQGNIDQGRKLLKIGHALNPRDLVLLQTLALPVWIVRARLVHCSHCDLFSSIRAEEIRDLYFR
ncbi:hypothetical protein POM88_042409 [Heracleum sosnowskyi]|uniref:ATP-dependent DNA helicase RecQ zinc-binding domain-containing protein n=1 Tax=Heracleum sosnowskyi TaxID=360622 RepID=A0AAD8HHP5_9APIA|nr:hypothetical protein POM88_042409 [Heracleum sosnowskyi]